MTSQQLPERPNVEQLKKQAKSLLHSAHAKDLASLTRFRTLPAFAAKSNDELGALSLALHDAQSVIAREHGFPSWTALREHVEERTLSFAAAVDEFIRCATGGAGPRAHRLLALHPKIAQANFQTMLVLGDATAVEAQLRDHPDWATTPGGVQECEPLLYVCHTCLHHDAPERTAGLVAIARRLLALGANPNAEYHWRWHPELPRTALWASLCTVAYLPLAEVLLEAGANPTDGVCLQILASGDNLAALDLLLRHGVKVDGIPGGVPPLVYVLQYATNPVGPRWLLEHGADANLPWGEAGEAPLHVAARRWDVAMVELLVRHGGDVQRRRSDGRTPHTLAQISGHRAVAEWLLAHGATDELSPVERFVAACARGDRSAAEAMAKARPGLRNELRAEHHAMLQGPAERGDAAVLETMLACGFDPRTKDKDDVTPLHRAAMHGRTEAVRALLAAGAPVDVMDGMFSGTPLLWAAEGWSHSGRKGDHPAVAKLLIAAGSPPGWEPPEGTPGPERVQEALIELRRAAGAVETAM